jgi:hypothetical protein
MTLFNAVHLNPLFESLLESENLFSNLGFQQIKMNVKKMIITF